MLHGKDTEFLIVLLFAKSIGYIEMKSEISIRSV